MAAMGPTIWFWQSAAAATSLPTRPSAWRMLVHLLLPLL